MTPQVVPESPLANNEPDEVETTLKNVENTIKFSRDFEFFEWKMEKRYEWLIWRRNWVKELRINMFIHKTFTVILSLFRPIFHFQCLQIWQGLPGDIKFNLWPYYQFWTVRLFYMGVIRKKINSKTQCNLNYCLYKRIYKHTRKFVYPVLIRNAFILL